MESSVFVVHFRTFKNHWPVIVLVVALAAVVGMSCYTNPSDQEKLSRAGGDLAFSGITSNNAGQAADKTGRSDNSPNWRKLFAWPSGVECLGILLTLICVALQASLTRQAIISSQESSQRQLRAYLGVVVGGAVYQEREKGLRFGALPILINSGQTPAYKVRLLAKAGIFPNPMPLNQVLSEIGEEGGETVLGINDRMNMHGRAVEFSPDDEVEKIKSGDWDKCLYTWGIVTYEDAFGQKHLTRFCHQLKWLPIGGEIYGYYVPNRNYAD